MIQSHFSATVWTGLYTVNENTVLCETVSLLCDSLTFLRQCGQGFTLSTKTLSSVLFDLKPPRQRSSSNFKINHECVLWVVTQIKLMCADRRWNSNFLMTAIIHRVPEKTSHFNFRHNFASCWDIFTTFEPVCSWMIHAWHCVANIRKGLFMW